MTEFRSSIPLPFIPDDLTVPQFLLDDYNHPLSEMRKGDDAVWLIDDVTGREYTFKEAKEGDVVLFFSPNHIDYVVATWAIHRLGATIAAANPLYTVEELENLLSLTKATRILTDERFLNVVTPAANTFGIPASSILLFDVGTVNPSSAYTMVSELVSHGEKSSAHVPEKRLAPGEGKKKVALLFFSSGTTGKPKARTGAVALSHYAVIANILQMTAHQRENGKPRGPEKWALLAGDVITGIALFSRLRSDRKREDCMLFDVFFVQSDDAPKIYWALFLGMTVDVVPRFSLSSFLTSITKYRIAHLYLVPPHVVIICKDPSVASRNFDHVKLIFTGAASLSVGLMHQATKVFPNAAISQGYGMTETIIAAIQPVDQRISTGGCGPMLPGFVAKVVKADGTLAVAGETGELVMTGPSVGLGYVGDEEATKSTFINGWVRSGDEVRFSESGELFVVDRLKELIKVRGFQVAPAEIEDHLMSHPHVADVCVVPIADEYSGELPLAFVVPSTQARQMIADGGDPEAIKEQIKQHVAEHKVKEKWLTGGVRFVDSVPKSPSGKLLRRVLRDGLKVAA
ncbi:phenylacetyl-CoA ligase [Desarmillaria tabescens]|uniref:Phenylacetyl-CoA ligase n=1 Tax=Armillaria tabescens TaxID=1929756 RepID=A0AA39J2M2_ARMTA|nr:phenylacetyl-CoA ligase [Desarmillaria tabescens]KAK0434156.1 phenylacetyl-CoA ligase [Desarmillaria tabescens]